MAYVFKRPTTATLADIAAFLEAEHLPKISFRDYGDGFSMANPFVEYIEIERWLSELTPNHPLFVEGKIIDDDAEEQFPPDLIDALRSGKTLVYKIGDGEEDEWVKRAKYHAAQLGL